MTDKCPKCDTEIKPLLILRKGKLERHYSCNKCKTEFTGEITEAPASLLKHQKDKKALPSLMKQATSFAKSAIKHVRSGMKNVSQEEIDKRIEICGGCEFFTGGEKPRCSKCGCHIRLKARWESSKCPIDKW